jgi:hypothetical protein
MKKTQTEYAMDLRTLRHDLNSTIHKVEKIQELFSDIVEKLDGLYDHSVSTKDQAVDLCRDYVESNVAPDTRAVRSTHYRMLAILAHYGSMEREHIASILGVKPETVAQYTHVIKHNGLAQLRSRKGWVSLQSLADGVRENENFRI